MDLKRSKAKVEKSDAVHAYACVGILMCKSKVAKVQEAGEVGYFVVCRGVVVRSMGSNGYR